MLYSLVMEVKDNCRVLRKKGRSYREISRLLNIPLSTVFLWTKDILLSPEQTKNNKEKSLNKLQESRIHAQEVKKSIYTERNNISKLAGNSMVREISNQNINGIIAALYWGEGFKKDRRLGLANTDPEIIKLFLYWLVIIAKVPKEQIRLKVGINILFKDRINQINTYWSKVTGIPLKQFQKPYLQNSKIKRIYPNFDEYFGVLRIRANGQNDVFQKLMGMVEKLKNETKRLDITDAN